MEEAAKKAYEEMAKEDSEEERAELKWEYFSKEGLYLHHTYDTIYPEYILVIEPILKLDIHKFNLHKVQVDVLPSQADPNAGEAARPSALEEKMAELKAELLDIKRQVKAHINNFWKNVKNK